MKRAMARKRRMVLMTTWAMATAMRVAGNKEGVGEGGRGYGDGNKEGNN
jgi:hypothetical protein